MLADCLTTLVERKAPPPMEVLVVDDGSENSLQGTVALFAQRGLKIKCIRQQQSGLNAARNRGVREAAGEVIAFLDDDTLVSRNGRRQSIRVS